MAAVQISILLIISILKLISASSHNYDYKWPQAPKYSDTCCQLEWQEMKLGHPLPPSYVNAGQDSNGYKYAFTMTAIGDKYVPGFKSDDISSKPTFFGLPKSKDESTIPILTNPNKCVIGYSYVIKNALTDESDWHFPTLGGNLEPHISDFNPAMINIKMYAFDFGFLTYNDEIISKHELRELSRELFVDCLASIPNMSTAELYEIHVNESDISDLKKRSKQIPVSQDNVQINDSPMTSEFIYSKKIEFTESAKLTIHETHHDYVNISKSTFTNWGIKTTGFLGFSLLGAHIGGEISTSYDHHSSDTIINVTSSSKERIDQMYRKSHRVESYERKILLAPFSTTTIRAVRKPIKGRVQVKVTFELTPKDKDPHRLKATLEKFSKSKDYKVSNRGTVLVTESGSLDIDAGYESMLSVKTNPLPGHEGKTILHLYSLQSRSYFLAPQSPFVFFVLFILSMFTR